MDMAPIDNFQIDFFGARDMATFDFASDGALVVVAPSKAELFMARFEAGALSSS